MLKFSFTVFFVVFFVGLYKYYGINDQSDLNPQCE
jgi:hypothetical protein